MITASLQQKKTTRIKFFAVYVITVVLIVVMFASLWKNEPQIIKSYTAATQPAATEVKETKEKIMQADDFLHTKLQLLDDLYATATRADVTTRQTIRTNILQAEKSFESSLDSLERVAIAVKDEQEKNELNVLISKFRKSQEGRSSFMNSYFAISTGAVDMVSNDKALEKTIANNNATIEELKGILVVKEQELSGLKTQKQTELTEKDRTIISLKNQLVQKPNVPLQKQTELIEKDKLISSLRSQLAQKPNVPVQTVSVNNDGEWKQKHAKLKASFDNISTENKQLKNSFKIIVEDNKRLLGQIQASKK